jgi:exodeoxyribonuclease VII small subunit
MLVLAKKSATTPPAEADAATFEQSLEALETIVRQLEEGRLGLSDSLQRYEDGVRHLKQCYQALETAERRIELLSGVDAEGNPVTVPFDEGELSLDQKAAGRSKRRSHPQACDEMLGDEDSQTPGTLF